MPNNVIDMLFSKSAHPSMITQVLVTNILVKGNPTNVILSIGKDGFFRVWDLNTCLCLTAISCNVT
jgi:WD40 repeat protein